MLAILGGLGAAAAWAVSTLCAARSSRMLGAASVLAWVALVGLLITGPVAAAEGLPAGLDASSAGWLALAGAGNVAGLLVAYLAYRIGDVALVAPVVSTEGAIAALIALATGEQIGAGVGITLTVIAVGISLAAFPGSGRSLALPGSGRPSVTVTVGESAANPAVGATAASPSGAPGAANMSGGSRTASPARVVALAAIAAACFGASLYATGRVSSRLPLVWVVLPPRLLGALAVALPLALGRRLRLTAPAAPLVLAAGVCEVLGFASFALGARHDIAIAAVLSAQFAALSALAAYALFGERLARPQLVGVVLVIVGVSALSLLRA